MTFRWYLTLLALLAGLSSAPAFAAEAPRFPVDHDNLAIGAKVISPDELKQMIGGGKPLLVIDVHPKRQFERETIRGAINIPLEDVDEGLRAIPKDTMLVFICAWGLRASQAAKVAEAAGFASTTFCPLSRWKDEGNEVGPGATNP